MTLLNRIRQAIAALIAPKPESTALTLVPAPNGK